MIEVVVIREQTSAVVVLLGIVNNRCVRLYSSMVMMVCSGMLAPDPSACDVRRRGDVVANVLWRSRASQAAEFHLQSPSFRFGPCMTSSHRVMYFCISIDHEEATSIVNRYETGS